MYMRGERRVWECEKTSIQLSSWHREEPQTKRRRASEWKPSWWTKITFNNSFPPQQQQHLLVMTKEFPSYGIDASAVTDIHNAVLWAIQTHTQTHALTYRNTYAAIDIWQKAITMTDIFTCTAYFPGTRMRWAIVFLGRRYCRCCWYACLSLRLLVKWFPFALPLFLAHFSSPAAEKWVSKLHISTLTPSMNSSK